VNWCSAQCQLHRLRPSQVTSALRPQSGTSQRRATGQPWEVRSPWATGATRCDCRASPASKTRSSLPASSCNRHVGLARFIVRLPGRLRPPCSIHTWHWATRMPRAKEPPGRRTGGRWAIVAHARPRNGAAARSSSPDDQHYGLRTTTKPAPVRSERLPPEPATGSLAPVGAGAVGAAVRLTR
jgi:hypothetical protein